MPKKTQLILVIALLGAIIVGGFFALLRLEPEPEAPAPTPEPIVSAPETPATSTRVIGQSVEGRNIEVYTFGTGETDILFVGGIHGGYEWNSILLAYEMMDFYFSDLSLIPENVTVHVIPNLNPDGMATVVPFEGRFLLQDIPDPATRVAAGRFNANDVDLNRNFGCKWAPESMWRGNVVSAGTGPFSEPEAAALRDYVLETTPEAVVFWHSQANNVYASECHDGPLAETLDIMQLYADAANYGAVPVFDAYPVTGDAEGWLASIGIPAITVELQSFQSIEFNRNAEGVAALLEYYQDPLAR